MSTHNSVHLPDDLITELRAKAIEQGKSIDQLAEETVRKGLEEGSWQDLLTYGSERAKASGYTDADIPNLVKEWRREQRDK